MNIIMASSEDSCQRVKASMTMPSIPLNTFKLGAMYLSTQIWSSQSVEKWSTLLKRCRARTFGHSQFYENGAGHGHSDILSEAKGEPMNIIMASLINQNGAEHGHLIKTVPGTDIRTF